MSKILITGAAGFIGTRLIKLFQGSHEIIFIDRRRPDALLENNIEWLGLDLSEPLNFSDLPGKVDAVIHLAQSRFYRNFPDKAQDIFDVNVQGVFQLLQYVRRAKVESFIFASTGSVYGYGPKKFLETDPPNPGNFYGISKLASELLIRAYEPFFRTVIFRFFFVYGPGQEKMLIPGLLKKVKTGETVTIKGDSGLRVNPIFVGDAVRVFDAALHPSVSGIFNVAGDEIVTIRELIGLVEEVVGKKASIQHTEDSEPGDLVGDNTRMKELLNVFPKISLREGLGKMV
jgi:nucleoside-diphosphate-sugar epimerase